jgi:hydroxyethylthiazole kinase-like uncharacterized protein yjeF
MRHPILTTAVLRSLEVANANLPLMERAGTAAADLAVRLQQGLKGRPLIFAGPGNNGGDAFVLARLLKQRGFDPTVVFTGESSRLPADAAVAYALWLKTGGQCFADVPSGRFGLVIDGLFGIGLTKPLEGAYAALIARINEYDGPVLALDIPSGIDADTGSVQGHAVSASHTLSFIALKPGLLTGDGPDHCGEIDVAALGLDTSDASAGRVLVPEDFVQWLRPRLGNTHKGSYGSVGLIGGAPGMAGAALLAGRAALRIGAGRVYVGMLEQLPIDFGQPELMLRAAGEIFNLASVVAIGPGLGQSATALDMLRRAVASDLPLVIDADALNLLADHPVLSSSISRRDAPTILTPHPAEAARLLGCDTETVQADRLRIARELARRNRADIVLKGCGSIVVAADGRWAINTSGNPGMASAGHGDVLTGIITALLAQGWPASAALAGAVHLHGVAADACAKDAGTVGLAASDVITAARHVFNAWMTGSH